MHILLCQENIGDYQKGEKGGKWKEEEGGSKFEWRYHMLINIRK